MNAPATTASLQAAPAATFSVVPLAKIEPSSSEIQRMRRARFTKESLEQLAASIRQVGVAEPVLLRPLDKGCFELVAGERRWMAARIAGLTALPAMVRAYTDEQALELQLIENLQRVDLHEMEEAEGYDALRKLRKLSVDQIAEQLGKSRSHVFARLKLLDLCPEARKAFYFGEMEASVALLLARLPNAETQRAALKDITGKGEFYWEHDGPPTFRQVQEHLQEEYMVDLKGASFQLNDALLLAVAGACTVCPKRTGNQKDLFTEIKNPNVCTDPGCFKRKEEAHKARVRAEHEAKGETIISGAQAKKIKPNQYSRRLNEGYIDLADEDQIGDKWQTYRKAISKQACPTVLLECPHTGKLFEIAKREDVVVALKDNGVKVETTAGGSDGNWMRDQKAKEHKARLETDIRLRILTDIRTASRARQFDREDTILVASAFFDRLGFDACKRLVDAWNAADGKAKPTGHEYVREFAKDIPIFSDADLGALFIDMALINECHVAAGYDPDNKDLLETAGRLGIDAGKIRADITTAAKEKEAAKKKAGKK
jgi:ParB/RepB/Spo0J family partition protein